MSEGYMHCLQKDLEGLIIFYNENPTNDIIIDKCKLSKEQTNYIYDKILINDEENINIKELSKKKYNLLRSKFLDTKIKCIINTLKDEVEIEKKMIIEREKLLAKRKLKLPPAPAPAPAPESEGSGLNEIIIYLLILFLVYFLLKLNKNI